MARIRERTWYLVQRPSQNFWALRTTQAYSRPTRFKVGRNMVWYADLCCNYAVISHGYVLYWFCFSIGIHWADCLKVFFSWLLKHANDAKARAILLLNRPQESTARRSSLSQRLHSYRTIESQVCFHSMEICGIALGKPPAPVRFVNFACRSRCPWVSSGSCKKNWELWFSILLNSISHRPNSSITCVC